MNDQIRQIAERLRGLRDVLELTAEDIARDSEQATMTSPSVCCKR